MGNKNFRFYIKIRHFLGFDANTIFKELNYYAGDAAPSLRSVYRLVDAFKSGKQDLEDERRSGRPIVETVTSNIEQRSSKPGSDVSKANCHV